MRVYCVPSIIENQLTLAETTVTRNVVWYMLCEE